MQQSKPPEGKPNPVISSFLNLCRVCPVPTDDKVNSEYKRNFTWHDGYQTTKVDVVRNAPSILSSVSSEPSLSRKKKYPGQPAKDHLLYEKGGDEGAESSSDSLDVAAASSSHHDNSRSRIPDEDSRSSSKMPDDADSRKPEEKQHLMDCPPAGTATPRGHPGTPGAAPEEGGGEDHRLKKTTEYRSQFVAWPRPPGESPGSTARKSASMGIIAAANRKDAVDGEPSSGELWNNLPPEDDDDAALDAVKRGRIKKTEYKAKFRPFSAYTYVDGSWKKATRLIKDRAVDDLDIYSSYSYPLIDGSFIDNEGSLEADQHAWYSEVVERLRKADQYRARSHTGAHSENAAPPDCFFVRDGRTVLSPCSVASSCRTWKDDRPTKERGRAPVAVHHRKDKRDAADILDYPKSRDGSTKKKPLVEKTTVRPKSAEPVIPVHKSPKRTRPRAPKDLPVKGHGDLSGRKKAYKQSVEKNSPVGMKPRAVSRPHGGGADEGKVWLKPDAASKEDSDGGEGAKKKEGLVNGFASEDSEGGGGKMVNGDGPEDYSVQYKMNGEHTAVSMLRGPAKVPLTTVRSPEEVTGVRSPDPESWTVPLEIGKGLHWMDGKTPDGVQTKGPPILLSKRLKESSLVGKSQKDMVLCDPGSEATGESVDL